MSHRAVVFAYHNVGYGCLQTLLDAGVEVPLVVTHQDNPQENIWFGSVAELAKSKGIAVLTPDDPEAARKQIAKLKPDFFFSFYYRHMLSPALLEIPARGAFNVHGSLLPQYRGRVPVNWAVLRGETQTGATLHEMTAKPDAGCIVDQEAVPILPDDTAQEVFDKVADAAQRVLKRALPALLDGSAVLRAQDLSQGSYFGGRKPEDGRIDWRQQSAQDVHNLVRAVAPPYPGAFCDLRSGRLRVLRTRLAGPSPDIAAPSLYTAGERLLAACTGGEQLHIIAAELDGTPLDAARWRATHGSFPFYLGSPSS